MGQDIQFMEFYHELLVEGGTFGYCREKALRFFKLYRLVSYEDVHVLEERSLPARHKDFWARVDAGIKENHAILDGFISELQEAGFSSISDINDIPQGYLSKLLHVITHILDGFFGVDSCFYNIIDDSHWLSPGLRKKIMAHDGSYWLIALEASSARDILGFESRG